MELHSEYEQDGFISFKDFCQIVTEKLNSEDDDFLIKSIFKCFKGTEQYNQDIRAPKGRDQKQNEKNGYFPGGG